MSMTAGQRWSKEKPTVPGFYWYREPWLGPEVVGVYQPNGPDTDDLEVNDCPIAEFGNNGEWQGPITPNEEA